MFNVSICVPTFKRPRLLKLLLADICNQSINVNQIIVVDGDPGSGQALQTLSEIGIKVSNIYVPSNYGNLSYQRYLGWRVARDLNSDVLIYFDDDQRILQSDVIDWLIKPFTTARDDSVVGVGCFSRVPTTGHDPTMEHLVRRFKSHWLTRTFGASALMRLTPGEITPTGHRIKLVDDDSSYVTTKWLHGRVMAFRMSAISQHTFSEDLFALDHIRCGLGEDTFLSRRVGACGKLLYTFKAVVEHPNADTPKSYPYEAFKYAYAASYSRRFQNDHYRVYDLPTLSDRLALVRSYVGSVIVSWLRTISEPNDLNFALARGTTAGAIRGLTRPPTAKRLTPDIDWWADAEENLKSSQIIDNRVN